MILVVNKVTNLKPRCAPTEVSMLLPFGRIGESSLKFYFVVFVVVVQ